MAVMISTNTFVKASFFEESRNLFWERIVPCNSRRFLCLNSKKSKKTKVMFCLNLNTKEVGGGFEFKPSFDQYLQIMESVKTERKKKKFDRLVKDKVEDDGGGNVDSYGRLELGNDVVDVKRKSGELKDEGFRRRYTRKEMISAKGNEGGFRRSETTDVKGNSSDSSSVTVREDESFRRRYVKQEMVSDRGSVRGFKRNEESGIQRIMDDARRSKSGESSSVTVPEDESFKRRYVKQEMVSDKGSARGFKRNEESGIQRIINDARWSKSGESSSVTVPEDESFKRRYVKQEMVSDKGSARGFKRNEESGIQRIMNDARRSKSGESLVTVPEDESFRRRYPKQEMVRYQRSSDTSRGLKGDGLDLAVEERGIRRMDRDVKWSKSGESSAIVPGDESFKSQHSKQEMMGYSDTMNGVERGSKGGEMDLVAEERRIERIANDLRRKKLSMTRGIGSKRDDDDDSLFDMETPAFRFSDESSDIVDKPRPSRLEMEDRIEKLAKVLNGADINMPEWQFSKAIRSAQIKYTDHTIMRLIHFLGKLGNWRRVLQVIEWLQRQERYNTNKLRIIYTTALNVLGKSRRPVEALNVFHAMLLQISSYPDMVAYRSIAVTLGQAGHIKELFHVIDTLRSPPKKKFKPTTLEKWDPRLEPDVVVYNAVLNACVQRKQWEGAFWVLQQLKQRGQKLSPVTYGLVMEVMLACEKYNLVHEFFQKMQKSSIPNALAYRVLVNALWKEGKTDEAIQTVEDMESRGIVGSAALYYDLARCLCSAGRCREGLNTIKKICRVANKPLVVTYTGLIQACLDSGNVKNAAYIFDQMKEICAPNLVTCNIMLKGYLQGGMLEEARELFQKMSEDGYHIKSGSDFESRVLPDTYTFNTMLDACAGQEKWDDFGYAYREMLRHGYHFNAKRHLRMVLQASRAGKEKVMEATWEHLRRSNRIPPSPLIKERFCRKLEKGDYVLALSSLADLNGNIQETELRAFSTTAWSKVLSRFEKDSVLRLMDDVNRLVSSRSEPSDSVLCNLLNSCKEFMKNKTQVL